MCPRSFSNLMISGVNHIFSDSVAAGARKAIEECKYQFKWDRWNCAVGGSSESHILSKHTSIPATKEMGFLNAMVSAAIVIYLTRNCSLGHFESCGCDDTKRKGTILDSEKAWRWGGCSDNVKFGKKLAIEFLDARESAKDSRALVTLHNNKVGRSMVKRSMRQICKCHGISGSCTTKTCYLRLPDCRTVSTLLKKEYESSSRVEFNGHGKLFLPPGKNRLNQARKTSVPRHIPRHRMIFLELSPNYCYVNASIRSYGTKGRECSRRKGPDVSASEAKSCKTLCKSCGLKVKKKVVEIVSTCMCKFRWCCHVKCKECKKDVIQYVCH